MKKIAVLLVLICGVIFQLSAQTLRFSTEKSISTEITSITGAEETSDDEYTVFAHYACDDARQKEIAEAYNDIEVKIKINGVEVIADGFTEISLLYSFQKDEDEEYLFEPSIQAEIPLEGLMQSVSDKINETGNTLSVEFVFEGASLATGQITFDVPEFGDAEGDFCGFRGKNYLTGEDQLIAATTEKFKAEHANAEFIYCWTPVSWVESEDENGKEMYTSVHVVYKEDGVYKVIVYNANKPYKNGAYGAQAVLTVDNYGGLENVHPACVESLMK